MPSSKPTPPTVSGALPLLGHALEFSRDRRGLLQRGYEEHGHTFSLKLGPQAVAVLIGPELHELFFKETDERLNISKPYSFLRAAFGPVLFIAPHEAYLRQRPLVTQAFRRSKMVHYLAVMQQQVQEWLDGLGEQGEFELTAAINHLVQDVAGHALMGPRFQQQVGQEFWDLYRTLSQSLDPIIPPNWPLPKYIRRDRARARMKEILRPILDERRRHPDRYDDFLQDFVNHPYPDGTDVEDEVLMGLMLGLMFAGHETTAGQAAWTVIEILRHPEYEARVRADIEQHVPAAAPFDHRVLRQLEHIAWAVTEVERLHPSADILLRAVDEPLDLGEYRVPTGWNVQVAAEIAHRLPELWTDPDSFDPLRFAPGRQEDKQHSFSLIGFGGGMHKCTGMNFANTEMMVIVARLLQQFDLELLGEPPGTERGLGANRPTETRLRYWRRRVQPSREHGQQRSAA